MKETSSDVGVLVLVCGLAVLIVGKLAGDWGADAGLAESVGLWVEVSLLLLFVLGYDPIALSLVVLFAGVSVAWHTVYPGPGCACLGVLGKLGADSAVVVAAAGGLLAVVIIWLRAQCNPRAVSANLAELGMSGESAGPV